MMGTIASCHMPNIIILLLDTARAQSFSGYGYTRPIAAY